MKTVFSPLHAGHAGQMELVAGAIVPGFEKPSRAEIIKARVEIEKLGPIVAPEEHDLTAAKRVHTADYIDFLPTVWPRWASRRQVGLGDAVHLADTWPARRRPPNRSTPCSATIPSTPAPASSRAPGAPSNRPMRSRLLRLRWSRTANASAFALCRPPGHHAGAGFMGGYCYINNAAVAAQWFRDQGAARVAILDVDYHHGNGTQEIFYARPDVLVVNLHGDPMTEYPFFLGHADESGAGRGRRLQPQLSRCRSAPRWDAMERGARGCLPEGRRLRTRHAWSSRSASTRSRRTRSASSS